MNAGSKVRAIRESRNLSVEQLAKLCEMRPAFLRDIEANNTKVHTLTLRRLSDSLNVPVDLLINPDVTLDIEEPEASPDGVIRFSLYLFLMLGVSLFLVGVIAIFSYIYHEITLF